MQVDPIKPTSKPPGTQRLKLHFDTLLSTSAFEVNSRRYNEGEEGDAHPEGDGEGGTGDPGSGESAGEED